MQRPAAILTIAFGFFLVAKQAAAQPVAIVNIPRQTAGGPSIQNTTYATATTPAFPGPTFLGVSWHQSRSYDNVAITAHLFPVTAGPGTAYLTAQIGPGTTSSVEIARATFNCCTSIGLIDGAQAYNPTLLFAGLHLGPGTYYLTLVANEGANPVADGWIAPSNPAIVTDTGASFLGSYTTDRLNFPFAIYPAAPYPPADRFSGLTSPPLAFNVTGTPSAPQFPDFTSSQKIVHLAEGAGWKTSFSIVNLDSSPVSYSFRFWDDNGAPLALPIVNSTPGTLSGTLEAGQTTFVETPGTSPSLLQGWAEVAATGRVGVLTIFKQSVPGKPDSEATVIGAPPAGRILIPFNNTQGYVTGLAVANTNALQSLSIPLLFQLENGTKALGSLFLPPHAHTAFSLPAAFPAVAGARGSVQFTSPHPDLIVLGLRFNPSGSFTSLGAFQ